ncbi:hypothetical protein K439DRAFT_1655028 [Ramaria rubella]|nr:hypothetical protein K439DRAFT_1655028 [Ramaria rubella]
MLFCAALLSLQVALSFAIPSSHVHDPRAVAFFVPANGGGSQLDDAGDGFGEPLNVIISGLSSPAVLTDDGVVNWAKSVGFSTECLGIHIGGPQTANLGDGNGAVDQLAELRQDFGDATLGTCLESLIGGNHFRYWRQNGASANSGALFLAVSKEEDAAESHTIVPNGYDIGRDALVANATNFGPTAFGGVTYTATSETISGLLPIGTAGVNHGIALDGNVALLTITVT